MSTADQTALPQPTLSSWAMVVTLGLVWGATFMGTEIALEGITPIWLAAGRLVFGSALMLVIWRILGGKVVIGTDDPRSRWPFILICGVLSSVLPFCLLAWGQQYVVSSFAGVSMATISLMVLPMAHFFIVGEQMTLRKSFGFLLGFVGTVLLIGGQALDTTGAALENAGRAACLGAAACYATSSVIMRRCPPIDPIALAALTMTVGAVIALPLAWIVEGPPVTPPQKALTALVILALIPTAAANFLRVKVIRTAGPTFMSLTNFQVPVWSVVFGALILSEPVPETLLIAMVLILTGVAISQWNSLKALFADMFR